MSGIGSGLSPGINAPSGSLGAMTVSFGADFSGFNDAVSQMGSSLNQLTDGISGIFGGAIGMVTGLVTGLGEAMIGVGAQSLSMAGDFQQQTNLLITSAGETVANIGMIRDGLLSMSVDTATGTANLVKGMFNIESAGYHGAAALLIEKTAAEGAKVENADLAATTDVLSTAMHNYSLPVMQATDVMNSFRMSASMGKMHMDDLTAAMKNVLPIASQAGVALTGVEAALSTMSLSGDKGASAGTHLSQMLTYLLAPSAKATKALTLVGLTTQQISDEMRVSLPDTVKMITDAVGEKFPAGSAKYLAAISAIVGGNKSMKAMLELSGQSLSDFIKNADQLAPTMTANSTAVDGWNIVQGNFNTQMESANNAIDAVFISIGQYLLPIVTQLLAGVAPLIDDLAQWIEHSQMLADASKNLTDYLGNLGQGFHDVFDPVKQVTELWPTLQSEVTGLAQTSLPPLTDALDRVTLGMKPMSDALDRATGSLKFVSHAFDPLTDGVNRT